MVVQNSESVDKGYEKKNKQVAGYYFAKNLSENINTSINLNHSLQNVKWATASKTLASHMAVRLPRKTIYNLMVQSNIIGLARGNTNKQNFF